MLILAIESSCDETSVSVVEMGEKVRRILSNKIASQVETHKLYGGVVPEIASRAHVEAISNLAYSALEESSITLSDVQLIAVTAYPGLIGALLVGVNFAKSLAYANGIPLVAVNHTYAHVAATYFEYQDLEPPFLAITVSGGHTSLSDVRSYTDFHVIGRTRDDAAGEAFDKVARIMGLPYPGGAELSKLAEFGDPNSIKFPSAAISGDTLDFSFSGLKTSVINYIHSARQRGEKINRENVAASFIKSVSDSILKRVTEAAYISHRSTIVLAGGVAANLQLRGALTDLCERKKWRLCIPSVKLCGDNGAMVGAQAYYEYMAGKKSGIDLNARATI